MAWVKVPAEGQPSQYTRPIPMRRPPGPEGHFLLGCLPELSRDWLGQLAAWADRYGDLVWLPLPAPLPPALLVRAPEHIERVLVDDAALFRKSALTRRVVPVVGAGLFTSDGTLWRRQRRMMQPAFHRERIAVYGEVMAREAEASAAALPHGEVCDIVADATRLALRVTARTLFGADLDDRDLHRIGAAMRALDDTIDGWLNAREPRAAFVAGPAVERTRAAVRALDAIIHSFIAARRAPGGAPDPDRTDLLSLLLAARDAEGGAGMSDRQVRDEIATLLLAGFGASSLAIAWSLGLLAHHPAAAVRLRDEVERTLGGRSVAAADTTRLPFADAVVRESLRLYPPSWLIAHAPREDWTLAGYDVPAGTSVLLCPWLTQRDPRFFPEPERFHPERWLDGLAARLPRFSWFPFGGGPRVCIGQAFAQMELVITLATLATRVRFAPAVPSLPRAMPGFTLRPEGGLPLLVTRLGSVA